MGQLLRIGERERPEVSFYVDGRPCVGFEGDTLLTALLVEGYHLRVTERDQARRSGFCVMGACQDCWVRAEDGRRLQACLTPLTAELRVVTGTPS